MKKYQEACSLSTDGVSIQQHVNIPGRNRISIPHIFCRVIFAAMEHSSEKMVLLPVRLHSEEYFC